jgi:hypothetical protein
MLNAVAKLTIILLMMVLIFATMNGPTLHARPKEKKGPTRILPNQCCLNDYDVE